MLMVRRLLMLWRIMLSGTRNFLRNAWLNLAATAVMIVTLAIVLGAVVFNMALGDTLDEVTEQVDIVAVYLEDGASQQAVETLRGDLEAHGNIDTTEYISKSEALERFRQDNADDQDVLDAVSEEDNPLPASVEARVADIERIDEVNNLVYRDEYASIVNDTSLGEDDQRTIERISDARQYLLTFGLGASLLFAAISILIIFNTIRIAIYARSEEIGIMRLIGATNSFIRGPFLFEAILNGVLAAAFALLLVYTVLFQVLGDEVEYVDFSSTLVFFGEAWPLVILATLLFGAIIGIFSSVLAMARHLRL